MYENQLTALVTIKYKFIQISFYNQKGIGTEINEHLIEILFGIDLGSSNFENEIKEDFAEVLDINSSLITALHENNDRISIKIKDNRPIFFFINANGFLQREDKYSEYMNDLRVKL
jgi:hypothetical protein